MEVSGQEGSSLFRPQLADILRYYRIRKHQFKLIIDDFDTLVITPTKINLITTLNR